MCVCSRREQLLDVKLEDVRAVAERYLVNPAPGTKSAVAVLGERKEWVKEEGEGAWKVLDMSVDEKEFEVPVEPEKVVL